MFTRLIAIMVAMSFVIIPAYAEEGTATTETPAVARQDKPAQVNLFDQLREAYEKNDREAMGKILDQMQERRIQMRQRRGEFRQGQQFREGRNRGFGQERTGFGPGERRGYGQMRPWQGANQGRGGWNRGPGQFGRGMHGRGGWGHQKDFGYGQGAKQWHRGGGRFNQAGGDWDRPRCEHAGRRFGQGQGWQQGYGQGRGGQWQQGGYEMRPGWQKNQWSDTDCERPARSRERSEWDW